jgi:mono/diheme cytochrome c family protein
MSRTIPLLAAAFTLTLAGSAFAQDAGQKAFTDANCNRCHDVESKDISATISSEKMKGPDLSKIGAEKDAEWITQFVKKEVQLDGKNHRMAWKGSDEDLKTIADWLASLK